MLKFWTYRGEFRLLRILEFFSPDTYSITKENVVVSLRKAFQTI
jgi:hypothetical protein